ncbi:FAD-dependent oxidoreductase [Microbacterium sulfonylureivorans]|uniref:FAD-dependent oxidoreductase n=1 Tax=Microbacterium sulfonylureivorans TaxID=2486854 RepID=UPI0013DEC645|nr:FAD-dependent oxidoreductase [Microbacterium sulfonylureivorans]
MRVAVIGGGAAGLTTAWLLDGEHDVTLFEKDERLGGHAHTVAIVTDQGRLDVDAGFQFFAPGASYRTFNRLLDVLAVPRRAYPATLTVFSAQRGGAVVMPPFGPGGPVWSSLTPKAVSTLLRFRRFLAGIPAFRERRDTSVTISAYLESRRLPKEFVDDFLFPLLLSFWCVEPEQFREFAAYNALYYLGANLPGGLRPPMQSEIPGGLRVYIDALAGGLVRTSVRLGADVRGITRDARGFTVADAAGEFHPFDRVVVATNARQARGLIGGIPELGTAAAQLERFSYFDTRVAIHGDPRRMPRDRAAWSVVNARWDGAHSALSIWNPRRSVPVFKSWVTFDRKLPEPVYALAEYEHGAIDLAYFDAQRRLRRLQGDHGLWLAGLYTDDADSHESAIRSAVTVARALAPGSPRLALLDGGPPGA